MARIKAIAGKSENKKSNPTSIGIRIRFIRGNLSQIEFGDLMGAHRNTVRRWEEGETLPGREILVLFMDLLKVNLNWLFSGNGEPFLDGRGQKGNRIEIRNNQFPGSW